MFTNNDGRYYMGNGVINCARLDDTGRLPEPFKGHVWSILRDIPKQWALNSEYDYGQMLILMKHLILNKIPFEVESMNGGLHIGYPMLGHDEFTCSVILHDGSYGREWGLLEIMGLLTDEETKCDGVAGSLTAMDIYCRIRMDWDKQSQK